MTTNINKTGTSYRFEVAEGDYVFTGTCENNLTYIHINSEVRSLDTPVNDGNANDEFTGYSTPSIGSFNYNRNENSVDLNTNIYDRAEFINILTVLPSVINAIIEEITK